MSGEGNAATLPALTGARWLAASAVFVHHAGLAGYLSGGGQQFLLDVGAAGHVGVSFFFVLSGFVLLWSTRSGERATTFWWRRVARVVPLHLVTAALALALGFTVAPSLGPRAETGGWPAMATNGGLLSSWVPGWSQAGNPVSWSLACEAFFYALFPIAAVALGRRSRRSAWIWLAAAAVAAVLAAVAIDLSSADLSRVPLLRLPEFVAGLACARLVRLGAWPSVRHRWALGVVALGWIAASHVPTAYAVSLTTLPGFVLLIGALAERQASGVIGAGGSALTNWLSRPWLVRLGEWSFAFYLVHILVMRTIEHTLVSHPAWSLVPGLGLLLGVLLVSVALSAVFHHAIEAPANAWIRARTQPRTTLRLDQLGQLGR
ncbi:acyltransferase [Knoellia sp. S7-12]|uniref:acyltransferase family protein n=1 Tax=Knoellia sp. S7-12 TaxID=3126698 RepID=UPI003368201D